MFTLVIKGKGVQKFDTESIEKARQRAVEELNISEADITDGWLTGKYRIVNPKENRLGK